MKRSIYCSAIMLIVTTVLSCSQGRKVEKPFGPARNVTAEPIRIDELLKIDNIVKLEDFIVLQNGSEGVEDFFFVYSYPEMKFLYSFAKRGRGPMDYMMPAVIKNIPGNILAFKDHFTDKVSFYELSEESARLKRTIHFSSPDKDRFFWELNQVEDSLFLVKHQGDKHGATELWSMTTGLRDSIRKSFAGLPDRMGPDYYTAFDDYVISSSGDRFVLGYLMIDRLEFGHVECGRIKIDTGIGAVTAPEFHLYGDDSETEFSIDRNIIYYENLYAGTESVFALYSGKCLSETEKRHSDLLEIYSWNGNPVELLKLDPPVSCFVVDESTRTVYGTNPELYEDAVLRYRY